MEKTYYVATLIFGCFITLAIASFAIVSFKMNYTWIGLVFFIMFVGSISMNFVFAKKWFRRSNNG